VKGISELPRVEVCVGALQEAIEFLAAWSLATPSDPGGSGACAKIPGRFAPPP
jgi:hypothetical protein